MATTLGGCALLSFYSRVWKPHLWPHLNYCPHSPANNCCKLTKKDCWQGFFSDKNEREGLDINESIRVECDVGADTPDVTGTRLHVGSWAAAAESAKTGTRCIFASRSRSNRVSAIIISCESGDHHHTFSVCCLISQSYWRETIFCCYWRDHRLTS